MSKLDSLDSSVTPAITLIEGIVETNHLDGDGWRIMAQDNFLHFLLLRLLSLIYGLRGNPEVILGLFLKSVPLVYAFPRRSVGTSYFTEGWLVIRRQTAPLGPDALQMAGSPDMNAKALYRFRCNTSQ